MRTKKPATGAAERLPMTAAEIQALAEALAPLVAQHLRAINERQTDAAFKLSRPRSERKKEWQAAMKTAKKREKEQAEKTRGT